MNTLEKLELIEPPHKKEYEIANFLRRQTNLQEFKICFVSSLQSFVSLDSSDENEPIEPPEIIKPRLKLPSDLNLQLRKLSIVFPNSTNKFEDHSNFIANFMSTLRELHLDGDFCAKTYNVVLNEMINLKNLSLKNYNRIPGSWLNEIGSIHSVDDLKVENSSSFALFDKFHNVKKLEVDCYFTSDIWTSISTNMPRLEQLKASNGMLTAQEFSRHGLVYPSLKVLSLQIFRSYKNDDCIFKESFPNIERLEIEHADGNIRNLLTDLAENCRHLKILKFDNEDQFRLYPTNISDLLYFLENCSPNFKRLLIPKYYIRLNLENENWEMHTEVLHSYIKKGTLEIF